MLIAAAGNEAKQGLQYLSAVKLARPLAFSSPGRLQGVALLSALMKIQTGG